MSIFHAHLKFKGRIFTQIHFQLKRRQSDSKRRVLSLNLMVAFKISHVVTTALKQNSTELTTLTHH